MRIDSKKITQVNSSKFQKFMKNAKIKPEETYKLVMLNYKKGEPRYISLLSIYTDEDYLFSSYADKMAIALLTDSLLFIKTNNT